MRLGNSRCLNQILKYLGAALTQVTPPARYPSLSTFPPATANCRTLEPNNCSAQNEFHTRFVVVFFFNVQFCFLFLLIFVARTLQKFAMCLLSSSSSSPSSSSSLLWFCFLTLFLILYKIFVVYCCFLIRR